MVIELANGAEGYIPPPEQHKLGGYTTWAASTAGLEVEAEPIIVETMLGLLEFVRPLPRRQMSEPAGAYTQAILSSRPTAYFRMGEASRRRQHLRNSTRGQFESGVVFYLEGPQSHCNLLAITQ